MKIMMFLIMNVLLALEYVFSFKTGLGIGLSLKNFAIYPIAMLTLTIEGGKRLKWDRKIPGIRALLVFMFYICMNILVTTTRELGLIDRALIFKSFVVDNFLLFVLPFFLIDDKRSGELCLKVVTLAFLLLNVLSLVALRLGYGLFAIQENVEVYGRFSGMFSNPNQMAYFLAFLVPLIYYFYRSARRRISKGVYFFGMMGCLGSIALSGSRGGILALFFVMITTAFVGRDFRVFLLTAGFCLMAVVLPLNYNNELMGVSGERLFLVWEKNLDEASAGRTIIWRKLFDIFVSDFFNAAIGTGFGTYRDYLVGWYKITKGSHNMYLQVLVELGMIGFAIGIAVLLSIYRYITKVNLDELVFYKRLILVSLSVVLLGWMFSDLSGILRFVSLVSGTAIAFLYYSQFMEETNSKALGQIH